MDCKFVAFVGVECYDLVHFLTRIALVLKCRSLVVDRTEMSVLMQSVPNDYGVDVIDYRGVDFTTKNFNKEELEKDYDYVFFYYGFDSGELPCIFEEIYCVTDYQKHHIEKLKSVKLPGQYCMLVLRDSNISKRYSSYVELELSNKGISHDDVYEIPFNQNDAEIMLSVQYDNTFNFTKISPEVKKFLVNFYSVDFKSKDVQKALQQAAKNKGV